MDTYTEFQAKLAVVIPAPIHSPANTKPLRNRLGSFCALWEWEAVGEPDLEKRW